MNVWLEIGIGAMLASGVYFVFRALCRRFARSELAKARCVKTQESAIEIYATADALEYYMRLSLLAADEKTEVVAYLKKESAEREEMLDTVLRFCRTHKNVRYQWI